jgi:hypothetical protein
MQASQITLSDVAQILLSTENPETRENGPATPLGNHSLMETLTRAPKGEVLRCAKRMATLAASRQMVQTGLTTPGQARQIRRNSGMSRKNWKSLVRQVHAGKA